MKTRIISFYSDFDHWRYYEKKAVLLKEKCELFNVQYHIVNLPSKGSYMLNCLQKPNFIKSMMQKYKEPLLWMDCDTDFKEPFDAFDNVTEDIGFTTHTGTLEGIKASPVYFNYGNNFNLIIDAWIVQCDVGLKQNRYELDHDALKHSVLPKIYNNISVYMIKENYNDYCNGRFINNGNSVVSGKREVHAAMGRINRERPAL